MSSPLEFLLYGLAFAASVLAFGLAILLIWILWLALLGARERPPS